MSEDMDGDGNGNIELECVYVLHGFCNSCMDAQRMDGEWSVEKVLQVIIINCRSWRGDGLKVKEWKKIIK